MVQALEKANPFWDFSVSLYAEGGVEAALLHLQDRDGLDVNMVLLCCYAGKHGARLLPNGLEMLNNHAAAWRETVVEPLRAVRKTLKHDVGAVSSALSSTLRGDVKRLELNAERIQQDMIYALLERIAAKDGLAADRAGLIRGNFSAYCSLVTAAAPTKETREDFEIVVAAVK